MTVLVLTAFLLIAIVVWLLARPLKQSGSIGDETRAKLDQYALARERLLTQLDMVEEQKAEGSMDSRTADDEITRLEVELASILKQIESCQASQPDATQAPGEQRLRWLLAITSFALVLPVVALVVYLTHQSDTLLTLAGGASQEMPLNHPAAAQGQANDTQQFPPEVLQMVKRLEDRLQANPDDGEGWKRLGRAYLVMGRIDESHEAYQRAASILPNDESVQAALKAFASAPASTMAQNNGGSTSQQFPPQVLAMVKQLEQKLEKNPDNGEGWKRLGRAYRVMGRIDESRDAYQKAARLLPQDDEIKSALSELDSQPSTASARASAIEDAPQFPPQVLAMVRQLEQKLQKNPNDGEGWKRLGRAYTVMHRYKEAVSAYTSAAEILPKDKEIRLALQQLAQIAASKGEHPEKANDDTNAKNQAAHGNMPKEMLQRVLTLEEQAAKTPKDPMVWARLGDTYMQIGRGTDAIRAFKEASDLAPQNPDILAAYAEAVFSNNPKDPDGAALKLYQKLNKLDPTHPDGLYFLGLAAYSEGNASSAIKYWTRLLNVLPPDSEGSRSVRSAIAQAQSLLNQKK